MMLGVIQAPLQKFIPALISEAHQDSRRIYSYLILGVFRLSGQ